MRRVRARKPTDAAGAGMRPTDAAGASARTTDAAGAAGATVAGAEEVATRRIDGAGEADTTAFPPTFTGTGTVALGIPGKSVRLSSATRPKMHIDRYER